MRFKIFTTAVIFAALIFTAAASQASDSSAIAQKAQQAASAGHTTAALGYYELALTESVNQPMSIFGPLEGRYWQLIVKTDNFPRAMSFYTALVSQQKNPNSEVLANKANAIGGYFGWLAQNKLFATVDPAAVTELDATARKDYARALQLNPDSFSALYGYAVYESYSPAPNGKAHMHELLQRLNSLRSSHPHYPWSLVDYLQTHGRPQM